MPKTRVFTVEVPSNIALIKYWGKRDEALQWPANDSLSMTLSKSCTRTQAQINGGSEDTFLFKGEPLKTRTSTPQHRVFRHLDLLRLELGYEEPLHIESHNTFPTSCGIASSASGMGALTLAALAAWTQSSSFSDLEHRGLNREKIAHFARRGSGSAGRSLFGGFVMWQAGKSPTEQKITSVLPEHHWDITDLIVIVSRDAKAVSSTAAHRTAWSSPLFDPRLAGLSERMQNLQQALMNKDFPALGSIMEAEALEMHSIIMTGAPPVNYLTSASCKFITWLRKQRLQGECPAYFTIDAGPNIHVLCETKHQAMVLEQIKSFWPNLEVICDHVGHGPQLQMVDSND